MLERPDWRSPDVAKYYAQYDNADFAQEFLRRNKDYRREYSETLRRVSEDELDSVTEMEVLARRWGMMFPM